MEFIGIPAKAFRAIRLPLISSAGGDPTWVILVNCQHDMSVDVGGTYVWSAISFPATYQSATKDSARISSDQDERGPTRHEGVVGVVE